MSPLPASEPRETAEQQSKHTPGPWNFRRASHPIDGEFDFGISAIIDGSQCCIAEAFGRVAQDIRPDAEANARLIAAAPDLLEALRECADDLEASVEHHYQNTKDYPGELRRYERDIAPVKAARAAIAKATKS